MSSVAPAEIVTTPDLRERLLAQRRLQALEEPLGLAGVSAGKERSEAAASDPAGKVVMAGDVTKQGSDLHEDVIGREMPDARVDRRQPVDVEHEQRQRLAPSARATELAVEQRMERSTVVELGQGVELGHGIGLA